MGFSVKKEWFANADCVDVTRIFKQGAKITETPPPRPAKIFEFPKSPCPKRVRPSLYDIRFRKRTIRFRKRTLRVDRMPAFFDAAGHGMNRRRWGVAVAGWVASNFRRPSRGQGVVKEDGVKEDGDKDFSDVEALAITS